MMERCVGSHSIVNILFIQHEYIVLYHEKMYFPHISMCNSLYEVTNMPTNLDIDDSLIVKAKKAGKHKTKKETVTQALIEYIERREQKKIVELFGTIEYDDSYSYKEYRSRK